MHRLGSYGSVGACGEAPVVLADFFDWDAVAFGAFFTCWPFGENIGNVVGFNGCAFIIEAESVSA